MIHPCWITTTGDMIDTPNANDHQRTAAAIFPDSANPEKTAEDMGWLKISGYRDPPHVWIVREPTQAQHDTMFRLWPREYGQLLNIIFDVVQMVNDD